MEKIVFYEDRNYQGRNYECNNDSNDLHGNFSRCNSLRVEAGLWVVYERTDYMGHQYVLAPGEYPDYQKWLGFNDTIRSCRVIRNVGTSWRLKVWERPSFDGQFLEMTDNTAALHDSWPSCEVHSCKVFEGAWVFYEQPNYKGRQFLLERGEYRRFADWGGLKANVGSLRRVMV